MNVLVLIKFDWKLFPKVYDVLVAKGFPAATFVSCLEEIASDNNIPCFKCCVPIKCTRIRKQEQKEFYGHFVLAKNLIGNLVQEMLSNGIVSIFCFDEMETLCNEMKICCQNCRIEGYFARTIIRDHINLDSSEYSGFTNNQVDEYPPPREIKVEYPSAATMRKERKKRAKILFPRKTAEIPVSNTNESVEQSDVNKENIQIKQEIEEIDENVTETEKEEEQESDPKVVVSGHMCACKLCNKLLRTKHKNFKRMKTLMISHAKLHTKPQYLCCECNYTCRFSYMMKLHISRQHHVHAVYKDLQHDRSFRDELHASAARCFPAILDM